MTGLVDGGYTASELWQAVKPLASVNMVSCPSFEVATTGWAATSGAITRVAGGKFGAWCGSLLASAANGRADFALPQATAGQPVTLSVYFKADSVLVCLQLIQDAATVEQAHPGDNLWHRVEVTATAATASTRSLRVIDKRTSAWTAVLIDGAQYEQGVVKASTYQDGDQDGCVWNGAPHLSTSTRDGRDGRGGAIVSLESLGFYNTQFLGTGAPPVDVASQESALSDGELFQRQRNKPRVMTLMGTIFGDGGAGGLASLHTIRRGLMDVFRPDSRTNRGPITLRYAGSAVPKLLPAYYQGGLEMDGIEASFEKMPLRLVAPDPDFVGETDEQASLTTQQNLASTRFILQRGSDGVWSSMAGGLVGGTVTGIYALAEGQDGSIYAGGVWTTSVGSTSYLAVWNGVAWSQVGGVNPDQMVRAIAVAPNGDIAITGGFSNVGAAFSKVARYTPSTNTWAAYGAGLGTSTGQCAEFDAVGQLWVGGSTGASNQFASFWNGSVWTTPSGLGATGGVNAIACGADGYMYVGTDTGVFRSNGGAFTSVAATNAGGEVYALEFGPDGNLYAGGEFTTIGGYAANRIAYWNGFIWTALSTGMNAGSVSAIAFDAAGRLHAAGYTWTTAGGISTPAPLAVWNGSSWYPIDVSLPTGASPQALSLLSHTNGAVTITWGNAGTAVVPVVTTVSNSGSSIAYPVIVLGATGLYSLVNWTTRQGIHFNITNLSDKLVIDLRPGRKTIGSPWQNEMPGVLPGSDFTTWGLAPGDNLVALFCSTAITAAMRWRPRYWSAD